MMSRIRTSKYPGLIELSDCFPKDSDFVGSGIEPLTVSKWAIPMHVPALETLSGKKYKPTL